METVDTRDASHRLSELLDKVEQGEEIVITRQGKPVAKLVQLEETSHDRRERVRRLVEDMLAAREGLSLQPYTWKELRDEGRK